jgi:hypothetical protein
MPFSNYNDLIDGDLGYEGKTASNEPVKIRSGFNVTNAILPYGRAVVKGGTFDDGVALPTGAAQTLLGVSYAVELEKRVGYSVNTDGDMGTPIDYELSYMNEGTIFVKVTEAVAVTDPVYYIHTPTGGERAGQWKKTATGATLVASARFLKSGAAGSVVPLAIQLP